VRACRSLAARARETRSLRDASGNDAVSTPKGLTCICRSGASRPRATILLADCMTRGLRGVKGSAPQTRARASVCVTRRTSSGRTNPREAARRAKGRAGVAAPLVSDKPAPRGASHHRGALNIPRVYKALSVVALLSLGQPGRAAEKRFYGSRGLSPPSSPSPLLPAARPDTG